MREGTGNYTIFDLSNIIGVSGNENRKKAKTYITNRFLKRVHTGDDKMRSEKIAVDLEEIWSKEKKNMYIELKQKLKTYLYNEIAVKKVLNIDFCRTLKDYFIEDPSTKFMRKKYNDETTFDEDDGDESSASISFAMGPTTSKITKFIFVHRNTHKFKFITFLHGIHMVLRRVFLLPLMYVVTTESNIVNMPLLLIAIVYALRGSRSIMQDVKLFMPLISIVFAFMFAGNLALNQKAVTGTPEIEA